MSDGVRSPDNRRQRRRVGGKPSERRRSPSPLRPPVYPERPHAMTYHGDTRVDPFYYMRDTATNKKDGGGKDSKIKTWLKQENAYASEQLDIMSNRAFHFVSQHCEQQRQSSTTDNCDGAHPSNNTQQHLLPPNIDPTMFRQPLATTLYKEMKSKWKETDMSLPTKDRSFWYFSRTYKGKEHPVYCRLRYNDGTQDLLHRFAKMLLEDPDAELPTLSGEEVLVDVNALEEELGLAYIEVGDFDVSPDETKLLISVDMSKGKEVFSILLLDLACSPATAKAKGDPVVARRPAASPVTPTRGGKVRPLSSSSFKGRASLSPSVGGTPTSAAPTPQHTILRVIDMFPSSAEVLWHTDDAFFYFALDDTHRPFRLVYHNMAHPTDSEDADVILFEELDPTFSCSSLCHTDDETWVQFCTSSKQQEEWHVMPVALHVPHTIEVHGSDHVFSVFHPRTGLLEYDVTHVADLDAPPSPPGKDADPPGCGGVWLVRNNRGGACRNFTLDLCVPQPPPPNGRAPNDGSKAPRPPPRLNCSGMESWQPLLRYDDAVTLEHVSCTKHFVCLSTRRGGCPMAYVMPMACLRGAIQRGRLPLDLEDAQVAVSATDLLMLNLRHNGSVDAAGAAADAFLGDLTNRSDDWAQVLSIDVSPCTDDYDCSELRLYAHHPVFPARVYHTTIHRERPPPSTAAAPAAAMFAPPTLLRYEHVRGQTPYDPNAYCVRRVWVPAVSVPPPGGSPAAVSPPVPENASSNTVRIPMTILYRASTFAPGLNPCLVTAYGSYGDCNDPEFTVERMTLLDRGVVYAVANVRGGGELGRSWRDAGRLSERMNSFLDFVDCSQYLVDHKFSHPRRLCSLGGSAGGTVVAAAMLLAPPGLYRAVLPLVPFVDCLTTMLDPTIPLTTAEWEDWGNPVEDAEAYHRIKAYSPMDNLHKLQTPSRTLEGGKAGAEDDVPQLHIPRFMFVESGYGDPRVPHWEPMAFVARLRSMVHQHQQQQLQRPNILAAQPPIVLHKCNLDAGHGGASGRYGQLKELADEYAFVLAAVYCEDD